MEESRVSPVSLLIAWLMLLLAAWPVVQSEAARRRRIPPDDFIASSTLFQQHQYPEAIAAARRYLRRKPDSAEALVNIGIAYASMGKWNDALAATQQALLIKPDFQLAWNNLRWILSRQSAAHPTAEAYQDDAFSLFQANRYQDCADKAGKAVKLFPQYTKAFNLLAVCQTNLGMYDEAAANARAALRIEPDFKLAQGNLKLALDLKAKGVVPATAAAAPAGGQTADGFVALSAQDYRAGRMQACVDNARAALKLQPNLAIAYNNIAACSNDLGRPDDGIAAAKEALRLQPNFELARNNLIVAAQLKAKQSAARK